MFLKELGRRVLDVVYPEFCALCGKEGALLCFDCEPDFPLQPVYFCPRCGKKTPGGRTCGRCLKHTAFSGGVAFCSYAHPVARKAIKEWKYDLVRDWVPILNRIFTRGLDAACSVLPQEGLAAVVPVPLTRRKLIARGFNQAEILARAAGGFLGIPLRHDLLVRKRSKEPQAQIESKKERRENVHGVFALRAGASLSDDVLLVDDVFTTGATLGACARLLKDAGANEIWAVTLAKG